MNINKCFFVLIVAMAMISESKAQSSRQVIKGIVTDQQTLIPIAGATLTVIHSEPLNNGTSDGKGYFRISNLDPGRYDIKVTCVGYHDMIVPNVVVTVGKEVELDVQLKPAFQDLQEVVISPYKKNETLNQMTTVSGRSFSMEEVNRFSGGRSDPARLVAGFAGVSAPDDYKNDIVIRGNSPTGVLWRLEGLNIPSPNHFSSLAATGAPVTLLNTNVLRNSDFFTSAYPAEYGNAVAGVFDMNMRNGNAEKREHSLQFGMLTGLEAVTEGPIIEGNNSSYLVAYRYAFTGLAKEIGIDLGANALPKFQDIAFKLNSGSTSLGNFSLFGMGGTSNINLLHDKIDTTDVFADPNRDMYTKSRIGIIGLKHTIHLNNNAYWNTTIGASYSGNKTKDDRIKGTEKHRVREANTSETRFSGNTFINYRIAQRMTLKAGAQIDVFNLNLLLRDREFTPDWNYLWRENSTSSLLSTYLQSNIILSSKLTLNAGLRSQYLTLNQSNSLEPRLGLKYKVNKNHSLSIGYGAHSQMQPFNIYSFRGIQADGSYDETNKNLGFTNSQHVVLAYDVVPWDDWRVKVETYYQFLGNVPVSRTPNSFSMLNEGGSYRETEVSNLWNDGTGKNYGVELTVEKFFSKGYYALFTGSLYKAKYKGSDHIERETVFSGNYVYNLLAGKEFKIGKRKSNTFFMDMKLTHAGGRPYTPVDLEASRRSGKEVLKGDDYTNIYRHSDFFRLDFKLGITLNSKKKAISHSFYYDFQNVTNNKNVFASQYNNVTKEVNTAYQMGLMPNFVYRVLF